MNDDSHIIQIESDSTPGSFYTVDTKSLTCTCPIFSRKLKSLPPDDPHRLCKHLTQALAKTGIPKSLISHQADIEWFAQQKADFTNRDSIRRDKKLALPVGTVKTVSVSKKRKYAYIEGVVDDKKISAAIPLEGGQASYTINNFHACYDLLKQDSSIPITYRNLEQAVVSWLVEEYNKVRNTSAPPAIAPQIDYTPIVEEMPEGTVETISIEKKQGLVQFFEVVDSFDEHEYYHLRGKIGRESVESIIRKDTAVMLYSINGSKVYSLDLTPVNDETKIEVPDFDTLSFTLSVDSTDKFPKAYWFIEKAVLRWLRDEFVRIAHS